MTDSRNTIKSYLLFALAVFIIGGFGSLIVHKYIAPYLSSKPVFRNIGFLTPSSPLVITRTEQVRVNENVNIRNLIKQVNPQVVTIVAGTGEVGKSFRETQRQGGVVLSSDGVIATDKSLFANTQASYAALLSDGRALPVQYLVGDPKSSVALVKVDASGLSAVSFGTSQELELGQQVIVLASSDRASSTQFSISYVASVFSDNNLAKIYSSENYVQTFGIDSTLPAGAAVFNLNGQLTGMGTGTDVIPAEVIRSAQDSYFASRGITRPNLGINYAVFGKSGSRLLGFPTEEGILVTGSVKAPAVIPGSPAARAGLLDGDIITRVNNENVTPGQPLSSFLNRSKSGDVWQLTVLRGGRELQLPVTLGELK